LSFRPQGGAALSRSQDGKPPALPEVHDMDGQEAVMGSAMDDTLPDKTVLPDLVKMEMPFGRYKGVLLYQLPEPYLVWFHRKGFPKGRLGILLSTLYEMKLNGLESLLIPLVSPSGMVKTPRLADEK